MPSTAAWMIETKMSSVKEFSEWQSAYLKDPRVNIEMGITYFAYLLEMFDQKKCPAIAAYNAGPGRLNEWITSESHGDADRFIENIPFPETQAYLKKVIQFYFLYSMIYTGHFMMDPCTF